MVTEYLEALRITLQKAKYEYPRVLAIRVDPIIPSDISDIMTVEDHKGLIKKFIASLNAIIDHDWERRRKSDWLPNNTLRYVWCREVGTNGKPHYHFLLILNRDVYFTIGKACSPNENLCSRISRAWYSALGVVWNPQEPWVHVPQNPVYWIERGDAESFQQAFYRASYLCKANTKQYGIGLRAFGSSRY
ncbi:Protein of unknown function [Franzmannia pantelleriensis]|uniref:YagK/YfjJ C-terminal domain-containing protein n=2 Tax=Franzmannia pantelleriensis TaxID=48727 RepID=A0A1G9L0K1_9GAMM|nr:Protein of unknown function [Halomonas pantelleriensis]